MLTTTTESRFADPTPAEVIAAITRDAICLDAGVRLRSDLHAKPVDLAARCGTDALTRKIETLRSAVRQTRTERPFAIDARVVLPDHMHCVWTVPEGDSDFSTRWSVIKARFSRAMPPSPRRTSHETRREHGLWQRRFREHHIRDEEDLRNHIHYCWINPVKHGLVEHPKDWPYSSYHRDHP